MLQIAEQAIGLLGGETGRFVPTGDAATNTKHTAIYLVWTYLIIGLAAAQLVFMAYFDCDENSRQQQDEQGHHYLFLRYQKVGGYPCVQSDFACYS